MRKKNDSEFNYLNEYFAKSQYKNTQMKQKTSTAPDHGHYGLK